MTEGATVVVASDSEGGSRKWARTLESSRMANTRVRVHVAKDCKSSLLDARKQGVTGLLLDVDSIGPEASASLPALSTLLGLPAEVGVVVVGRNVGAHYPQAARALASRPVEALCTGSARVTFVEGSFPEAVSQVVSGLERALVEAARRASTGKADSGPSSTRAESVALRPVSNWESRSPQCLLVGSSTGGPQAVLLFIKALGAEFRLPILLAQHMPKTFTGPFAERITRETGRIACEGVDGAVIEPGTVHVAPGDFHMLVASEKGRLLIRLTSTPPENFCRPAVDPLFRSGAAAFGRNTMAVVLTGMGSDGLLGAGEIVRAGGIVSAQDKGSSVIWGMPGAVANAGLASFLGDPVALAKFQTTLLRKTA